MGRAAIAADVLDSLVFDDEYALLGDLVFRLPGAFPEQERARPGLDLYKDPGLIEEYSDLWRARGHFDADRILELGTWHGGSAALWTECFRPAKYVGVDLVARGRSEYFDAYRKRRALGDRLSTHWGIDQSDRSALLGVVESEFAGSLDLIIDDASHRYEHTRASFEALFPLLRPGGLYVIEDWAWGHWAHPSADDDPRLVAAVYPPEYDGQPRLSCLIRELVLLAGSTWLFREVSVRQGIVAVERSETPAILDGRRFDLAELLRERARPD